MPEPATTAPEPEPEPFRVSDDDLDDLASTLAATIAEVHRHGVILDRLGTEPEPLVADDTAAQSEPPTTPEQAPRSPFILAMGGTAYATELAALTYWVRHLLLPVYGREISTTRPWCAQWQEHPEAVARLHALWLAWQQLTDHGAGQVGASTWHRDHLDHAMAQLRAPDGPFAACTTSAARPTHRLLATPAAVPAAAAPSGGGAR
jgi:hypothetical protein